MKESPAPISVPAPAPQRSAPPNVERQPVQSQDAAAPAEVPASNTNAPESGVIQEGEGG